MVDVKLIVLYLCFIVGTNSTHDKVRCRFPAQWQSNVYFDFGLMFTVPTQARASGIYYYDYTNNQTRLDLKGIDLAYNTSYDYTFLWKFNESAFYTVDYINKSCDREEQQSDFWWQWEGVPCIAHLFRRYGGNQLRLGQYDFLKIVKHSDNETLAVAINVKVGDICPPSRLVLEEYGFDPLGMFAYNYEFLDPSDIKNPKVFDIPTNCKNITTVRSVSRNRRVHRHIGLFVG